VKQVNYEMKRPAYCSDAKSLRSKLFYFPSWRPTYYAAAGRSRYLFACSLCSSGSDERRV